MGSFCCEAANPLCPSTPASRPSLLSVFSLSSFSVIVSISFHFLFLPFHLALSKYVYILNRSSLKNRLTSSFYFRISSNYSSINRKGNLLFEIKTKARKASSFIYSRRTFSLFIFLSPIQYELYELNRFIHFFSRTINIKLLNII